MVLWNNTEGSHATLVPFLPILTYHNQDVDTDTVKIQIFQPPQGLLLLPFYNHTHFYKLLKPLDPKDQYP